MELLLAEAETEVLRTAVKDRLDTLIRSLSAADGRSAKSALRSEIDTLEGIYGQLGCVHETGAMGPSCNYIEKEDSPESWMGDAD